MANTNVGSIEWLVDADTHGAVNSMGNVNKTIDKTEGKFKKLDTQTTKTSKAVQAGMAGMSRQMGMAGVQVQQFMGQLQGGQNAMLALSQQGADFGIVMGAPMIGALVGISATVAGMLLPALFNSKTATEELEVALEALKGITYETSDGTVVLSESIEKLAKKSRKAAMVELANGILKAKEAMKASTKQADEAASSWEGMFQNTANALIELDNVEREAIETGESHIDVINRLGGTYDGTIAEVNQLATAVSMMSKEYGITETQSLGLLKVLKQYNDGGKTSEGLQVLAGSVSDIALATKKPKQELVDLAMSLNDASVSSSDAAEMIELFTKGMTNFDEVTKSSTETTNRYKNEVDSMIAALTEQAAQIGETSRQTAMRIAVEKGATAEQKKAIVTTFDRIEAEDARAEKAKEVDGILARIAKEDIARDRASAKEKAALEKDKNKAIGFAEGVSSQGATPLEALQKEQEQLLELKAKYVEDSAVFDEALTVNANKQADLRAQYQVANANMIMSSSASMFGNIASMLESSGKDQSTAYKAMFALSKGFAIAQAAMNLALAISNASAVSPWYASLAAIAQVTSAGAGMASAIAGATYSGREHGGSVNAGQTYEVGEKNKPELLMIPGNNGKVLSNAEMKSMAGGSGGGGGGITINNYAAADGYSANVSQDPLTQEQVIDIVRNQMGDPNSKGRRAQQSTSNVTGVLNGQRRR